MRTARTLAAALALLVATSAAGTAQIFDSSTLSVEDAATVDEAVATITATLQAEGFEITAVINHEQNAAGVGLELRPTQVILFRAPFVENILLRRRQTAGLDIPFKILVHEDELGEIQLKYNDAGYLVERHDIPVFDFALFFLDSVMDQFGNLENGIEMVDSSLDVDDTVASLREVLTARGFAIPIEIDFGANSRRLRDTKLLIFGNPNVGTILMQNEQEVGLDLPQKFLVFENSRGDVKIAYNDPFFVGQRAGLQGLDMVLGNIANALRDIAETGGNP